MSAICACVFSLAAFATDTVKISGTVTDYNGSPVDSCTVLIYNPDFTEAYETASDTQGHYSLDSIPKGKYAAIAAMRVNEYPRMLQVAPEDMKLEFWAWNVIADRDHAKHSIRQAGVVRYDRIFGIWRQTRNAHLYAPDERHKGHRLSKLCRQG